MEETEELHRAPSLYSLRDGMFGHHVHPGRNCLVEGSSKRCSHAFSTTCPQAAPAPGSTVCHTSCGARCSGGTTWWKRRGTQTSSASWWARSASRATWKPSNACARSYGGGSK